MVNVDKVVWGNLIAFFFCFFFNFFGTCFDDPAMGEYKL